MKQAYAKVNFRSDALTLIQRMNVIIDIFTEQGFKLTVRQLYYQLVATGVIENTERSYKRVGEYVGEARLCGLIDWDAIEDRTRAFIDRPHWHSPEHIVGTCAEQFYMSMWENQPCRVFVIVEKEALAGVLEPTCRQYDVPLLAARGYPSVTVLREFAMERLNNIQNDVLILHLGDHDPSGIDMTRDLKERIELFSAEFEIRINFKRIALNMRQIDEKRPPPNPAKTTDSRFKDYRRKYGDQSWELDALSPAYLAEIITKEITDVIDSSEWEITEDKIKRGRAEIGKIAEKLGLGEGEF